MLARPAHLTLTGATALVTGGSSGIGAATAELLSDRGCRLVLVGRDADALHEVARRTGGHVCTADLALPQAARQVRDEITSARREIGLLVCNAGVGWAGPLEAMPFAEIERLVQVNLLAALRLVREFVPGMVLRGRGHVVLVSSIAGSMGVAGEAVYAASKAALRVFGDSLRMELAGKGIGVTVVVPGVVDTAFFDRRGMPYQRRRPRPVPAEVVARALVDAVERNEAAVFVPRWLWLPARLQCLAPRLVGTLRRRLG